MTPQFLAGRVQLVKRPDHNPRVGVRVPPPLPIKYTNAGVCTNSFTPTGTLLTKSIKATRHITASATANGSKPWLKKFLLASIVIAKLRAYCCRKNSAMPSMLKSRDAIAGVCFVVPCHFSAKYVGGCIASIRNFHPNSTILIVEDSGCEKEAKRVLEILGHEKDLIFLKNDRNRGVVFSRNRGFRHALNDDVVVFLDSDDLLIDRIDVGNHAQTHITFYRCKDEVE